MRDIEILGDEAFALGKEAEGLRAAQILSMAEQITSKNFDQNEEAMQLSVPGTPKLRDFDAGGHWRQVKERRRGNGTGSGFPGESQLLHRRAQSGDINAALELIQDSTEDESLDVRVAASSASVALDVASGVRVQDLTFESLAPIMEALPTDGAAGDIANALVQHLIVAKKPASASPDVMEEQRQGNERARPQIRRIGPSMPLSLGVHGTFARRRPSPLVPPHDFNRMLRREVTSSLYPFSRGHFRWTSRYRAQDRAEAAADLAHWAHLTAGRDQLHTVFAHSHGGNVVLDALARGLVRVDFLVLLSVPAIRRSREEWEQINSNVRRIISYRAGFDPVIAIDRLFSNVGIQADLREATDGPEFPSFSQVRQQPSLFGFRLGFSHSDWLNSSFWRRAGLYDDVRHERAMAIGGHDPAPPTRYLIEERKAFSVPI